MENVNTENIEECKELSSTSKIYGGCEFSDVEKCVKRLTYSMSEEVSPDEGNILSIDQQDDSQTIDVPLFHGLHSSPIANDTDGDSEYVPTEHSSSSHIHDESIQHVKNMNKTTTSVSSLDTSNANTVGTTICNDEIIHLVTVHRNKAEVKKFVVLPAKHPERLKMIEAIRKNGNFKFNTQAELNTGQLIFNLNDTEISDLATFMGHADKIHKEHYRQPQASRDILKISRYLEAVQGGNEQESENESNSDSRKRKYFKPGYS
nr:PREDICTED: uncharacterized protein LOC105668667 [Linepithema humile]